jgi:methionyl-tRNA synthetase
LADEIIKDNPERVQTQMYVALQIAVRWAPFATILRLPLKKLSRILK